MPRNWKDGWSGCHVKTLRFFRTADSCNLLWNTATEINTNCNLKFALGKTEDIQPSGICREDAPRGSASSPFLLPSTWLDAAITVGATPRSHTLAVRLPPFLKEAHWWHRGTSGEGDIAQENSGSKDWGLADYLRMEDNVEPGVGSALILMMKEERHLRKSRPAILCTKHSSEFSHGT